MISFLNKVWELLSKPRMLLIFIFLLLAVAFFTIFDYTAIKLFLMLSIISLIYPVIWLVAMFGYLFIVRPFNFIKNKFKKS